MSMCLCASFVYVSVLAHVYVFVYLNMKSSFMFLCLFFSSSIHSSYNGISSLPPLELWRFPSLKALFLQGKLVLIICTDNVSW